MAKLRRRARAFQLTGAGLNIEVLRLPMFGVDTAHLKPSKVKLHCQPRRDACRRTICRRWGGEDRL